MAASKSHPSRHGPLLLAGLLVLGLASGCATAPSPTSVYGAESELASLAGVWNGQYWSADTGRSGTIRFELAADGSGAWGDVDLVAATRGERTPANPRPAPDSPSSQQLAIRFVRVGEGTVSGTLEPYRDPDCGCVLSTTFVGLLEGNKITGTYLSNGGPGHAATSGQWRAERVAASRP
jgi:hypothetical protein